MSEAFLAPAQTYELNSLASVLGRYAVPEPSVRTLRQVNEMLESTIDSIASNDAPEVPHTNSTLLAEAAIFDRKLLRLTDSGPAVQYLTNAQCGIVKKILNAHLEFCTNPRLRSAPWQQLASTQDIASAYGLPNLWDNAEGIVQDEIERWGYNTTHPEVATILQQNVTLEETRSMLNLMWRKVIEVDRVPLVNTYIADDPGNYHVYWAPLAEGLDYATPRNYDRATQLSFDLPHNATHLAHLDAMSHNPGAKRYDDGMAIRAYFEAVTVFSENKAYDVALHDSAFADELSDILGINGEVTANAIAEWVAADRKYEFKLRAARYAADVFLAKGMPFEDTAREIKTMFNIPLQDAKKETLKYIAWTGLGAAYTFGYRQLESLGVTRVIDAIRRTDGTPITSWGEMNGQL